MRIGALGSRGGVGSGGALGSVVSYDPAAVAIFNAFTVPPTTARKQLINTCVVSLKTAGVWQLLDCLWFMDAADSQAAAINWINPATFTLTNVGSMSFIADRGFTGNGSSSYLNTGYVPSTAGLGLALNDAHYSGWSLTAAAAGSANRIIGNVASTTGRSLILPRNTGDLVTGLVNGSSGTTISNASTQGHFLANRAASNATTIYKDGASIGTTADASNSLPTQAVTLGRDTTNFASLQLAGASIGRSLTSGLVTALYNAMLAYHQGTGAVAAFLFSVGGMALYGADGLQLYNPVI